jgi:hypothetical protein
VNTNEHIAALERCVRDFAAAWLRLGEPGVGDELVADPILVLGPGGTSAVPRAGFLAAVAGRQARVSAAATAVASLTGATVTPLGDRLVLATMTWTLGQGRDAATLVSDFLLLREGGGRLRCVAYLPRTNVLDHLR